MRKTNNIIEINGKRYDTHTGALLSSDAEVAASKPKASPKPAPVKTAAVKHTAQTGRSKPRSLSRTPAPAKTLMRQAVRKPTAGLKRRNKANGPTDSLIEKRPLPTVKPKQSSKRLDTLRLQHARHIRKSRLVSRFSTGTTITPAAAPVAAPARRPAQAIPTRQLPKLTKRPKTTADLLEHALQQSTSHLEPPPAARGRSSRRKLLRPSTWA